jgi:CheY-like chemotaxis protein
LRVLVVDDEPETRDLLAYVISECDAEVTAAASAREALDAMRSQRFDVVVSDLGMPAEDGNSLIRKIRLLPETAARHVPALALSAYARSEDRAAAFRSGFDMHLAKPIDPAELLLVIARLVSRRARGTSGAAALKPDE